ncbi:hypothetical protein CkaCkLH20_10625 [Colletotrichum karsti]|uniref:Heterokaryon incompatibility domain-containing protein n=1 Tax=Colletotrichum karsti TaxID=1095194 RepID=A0A9P6LFZ6_9PEZI|nr:uncharacterized protein CkaCkLH20_10625 [Colletotrichum karsti]KAF9871993.1 hypothetical protein CkaCkLH20_10625 [Colletotrichum karsti]
MMSPAEPPSHGRLRRMSNIPESPQPSLSDSKTYVPSETNSDDRRREIKVLCRECKTLDLGVHSFKVQSSGSQGSSSGRPLRSYTTARQLGTLRKIRARSSSCPVCALIVDSVQDAGTQKANGEFFDSEVLEDASCSLSWEIDGREAASSSSRGTNPKNMVRGLTRRLHIRWGTAKLSDAYLVYVAPETFARTASDADRVWAKDSLFLGRTIAPDIENQALIRSWLDLCQKSHRGPCREDLHDGADRFDEMVSHSYFGVIDVQNMQLTQLPRRSDRRERDARRPASNGQHEPYVALSYVWGGDDEAYKTTTDNVMLHRTHGGLENALNELPKAIQDSFDLTRRLGFSYIWIDRLCIVQNSPRSWKLNAYNMDLIYGNAALTICAADGDASEGLKAMKPEERNKTQYKRAVIPRLDLMVTRPPEIYIRASEWNERAWTFQERLLSRRCLIFTNGRVYFQCRSTGMSEDIFGDQKGAGWSLDLVDAPMQMFRQLNNRAFWVYMKCVELYTERKLSHAQDILAAFSGMANMMQERMRAPFVHGLPSSHFDLALLWQPVRSLKRRIILDKDGKPVKDGNHTIPDFPSWSWTGWMGEATYQDDLVGGVLDNVSQWLDTHTWIQWWVRDGHGDLRPLWDYHESEEDISENSNWKGYTQRRGAPYQREFSHGRRDRDRHADGSRSESEEDDDRESAHTFTEDDVDIVLRERSYARENIAFYEMLFDEGRKEFNITLRDYPYRVVKAPFDSQLESSEFPLLPILQFRTWHTWLHITEAAPRKPHIEKSESRNFDVDMETVRYHIADEVGDWCGSIVLDAEWAYKASGRQEFIAISEAKNFTLSECQEWTYYIPKEREQSEWDLFYVLLIERKDEKWERVGAGKVFKESFRSAKFKEIMLS